MPTKYKRKPGNRRYLEYTKEELRQCLRDITLKRLTQREASVKYNIPRSSIKNKLHKKCLNLPGHPPVFTAEEEQALVDHIHELCEFGLPVTKHDTRFIIHKYLTSHSKTVKQFRSNTPGRDWLQGFFDRNEALSSRLTRHAIRAQAAVTAQNIADFIENLEEKLKDIPPENVYNFNECILTDDPDKNKVLCRRSMKYLENVDDYDSNYGFSVMFCGNAAGEIIPPYITYGAECLLTTWTENGPRGASYNTANSGWMDDTVFENWFVQHLLPIIKERGGRKVLIGDNLSSHFNINVIRACETNDITFICLPANTTSIIQPLDMSYFRSLNIKWQQALLNWKNSNPERKIPYLPNDQFPMILKETLDSMDDTQMNLINGFRKAGIYPQNLNKALTRLAAHRHDQSNDIPTHSKSGNRQSKNWKEFIEIEIEPVDCKKFSTDIKFVSFTQEKVESPYNLPLKQIKRSYDYYDDCAQDIITKSAVNNIIKENFQRLGVGEEVIVIVDEHVNESDCYCVGDYVVVEVNSKLCPGKITSIGKETALVRCMKKGKYWKWPEIKQEKLCRWKEVLMKIKTPKLVKKGLFTVPEIDKQSTSKKI